MKGVFGEFALSEFSSAEFALDGESKYVSVSLHSLAGAETVFPVLHIHQGKLLGEATAVLDLRQQFLNQGLLSVNEAATTVDFDTQIVLSSRLQGIGSGNIQWDVGRRLNSILSSVGFAEALFTTADGIAFDIRGESLVIFPTGVIHQPVLEGAGTSPVFFVGSQFKNTGIAVQARSSLELESSHVKVVLLSAAGKAENTWRGQSYILSSLEAFGAGAVFLKGQYVVPIQIYSVGASHTRLDSSQLQYMLLKVLGESVGNFQGTRIYDGVLEAQGFATTVIKPGTSIMLNMPYAFDVVIRPEEIRGVVWK